MEDKKQPIIVKKITVAGGGHHGGSWKVAFADFATAMMAFFMVMWLLGTASVEQKAAISSYFQNPSLTEGLSQKAAKGQDGPGGASTSMIKLGGTMELPRGDGRDTGGNTSNYKVRTDKAEARKSKENIEQEKREAAEDKRRMDSLMHELKDKIGNDQALKPFKDQLLLDITPEGLRIQIVDKKNRPMFASGSSTLKYYTTEILHVIAQSINKVPNRVSISGHTDATPFASREDYSNWELSADRANSARRALIEGGLKAGRIGRVVGLADSVLFNKKEPTNPINRRISIIIMNRATERALNKTEGSRDKPATKPAAPAPAPAKNPAAPAPAPATKPAVPAPAPATKPAAPAPAPAKKPAAPAPAPAKKPAAGKQPAQGKLHVLPGQKEPEVVRIRKGQPGIKLKPVIKLEGLPGSN